jgi:hypothetical protein
VGARVDKNIGAVGWPHAIVQLVLPIATPSRIMQAMTCAVFYRGNGGKLSVVTGDDGTPCEFADRNAAIVYTERTALPESEDIDYQIVELDEL